MLKGQMQYEKSILLCENEPILYYKIRTMQMSTVTALRSPTS